MLPLLKNEWSLFDALLDHDSLRRVDPIPSPTNHLLHVGRSARPHPRRFVLLKQWTTI
jgi:hypothetical protein